MQGPFSLSRSTLEAWEHAISSPRFGRYVRESKGNRQLAVRLYQWNSRIGQSLYWPLQTLEIVARNGISRAIADKFGPDWHLESGFHTMLAPRPRSTLDDAVRRQKQQRRIANPSADSVIADISFGFWSTVVTGHYHVPLGWAKRLPIAFPFLPGNATREMVSHRLDGARDLRNRISHHEPLLGMRLTIKYSEILELIGWVCPATRWYVEQHCTFITVWETHPAKHLRRA